MPKKYSPAKEMYKAPPLDISADAKEKDASGYKVSQLPDIIFLYIAVVILEFGMSSKPISTYHCSKLFAMASDALIFVPAPYVNLGSLDIRAMPSLHAGERVV